MVYLVVAVLSLYSWAAVLATYRLISNPGYNYSPAPVKPAYGTDYYPSAPQHFVMEEYRSEHMIMFDMGRWSEHMIRFSEVTGIWKYGNLYFRKDHMIRFDLGRWQLGITSKGQSI